ncbi:MAG: AzlC family ABC transporter permease [Rhodocyclaceae bacterium]|jgi:predicted branched-subunit amino acid permease|nr:AzlC family ABC transporter permease [Rhodocyclaceae bacterium]MCL4757848.1 AzlC family ABC transporter permease [Rhodocyclaceae bacterium]
MFDDSFRRGAREGFRLFLPLSIGLIPWALVTGVAMRSSGLSVAEAIGMNAIVFAGTAQLGSLPLLMMDAPMWLVALTTAALNLRFLIFSAAIAPAFRGYSLRRRLLSGYLLVDGVFAVCADRMLKCDDPRWRWGCFIAPSVWCWVLWQGFGLLGILGAGSLPADWSLEFMATIALLVMLVPMASTRPLLVSAVVGGLGAVMLRGLPLKLGLIAAIMAGMVSGFATERWIEARKS